jgi:hypothetical protein
MDTLSLGGPGVFQGFIPFEFRSELSSRRDSILGPTYSKRYRSNLMQLIIISRALVSVDALGGPGVFQGFIPFEFRSELSSHNASTASCTLSIPAQCATSRGSIM